jgi:cytochrome d ubiquinol oxidase subunit II
METMWFCAVALMLAIYVVLDGFDLGAGIVHWGVARTDDERKQVLRAIGPVWGGSEVWLLAAGGTLYFAFPVLYAASFRGFYLPLMIVLWLLVLRRVSIQFRRRVEGGVWKPFWDAAFIGSCALLAIFLGAALGNVMRGVPLDASGNFFLPLWTDFSIGAELGVLDWYTILVGMLAYFTLTQHGALWLAFRASGVVAARARIVAAKAWWAVALLTAAVTLATLRVQLLLWANLESHRWGFVFPALAVAGLLGARYWLHHRAGTRAFFASAAYIAGMLSSAAFGIFPNVLPSTAGLGPPLTIHNAAAPAYGLQTGLVWFIPGMILATVYFVFLYRHMARQPVEDA